MADNAVTMARRKAFAVLLLMTLAAVATINVETLPSTNLVIPVRVSVSLLLVAGLASYKLDTKIMRVLGWLGIISFLICLVAISIPDEDYTFGGLSGPVLSEPRHVNVIYITMRLFFLISIGISLVWSFRNVRPDAIK